MSPKAKSAPKKETKTEAKVEKKAGKSPSASVDAETDEMQAAPAVDPDELEEQEEQAEAASHGGGGGNAAALAAASGGQDSASFKNFRHHPDMENFYRFIFENDLRHEALAIIETIMAEKAERRAATKK